MLGVTLARFIKGFMGDAAVEFDPAWKRLPPNERARLSTEAIMAFRKQYDLTQHELGRAPEGVVSAVRPAVAMPESAD